MGINGNVNVGLPYYGGRAVILWQPYICYNIAALRTAWMRGNRIDECTSSRQGWKRIPRSRPRGQFVRQGVSQRRSWDGGKGARGGEEYERTARRRRLEGRDADTSRGIAHPRNAVATHGRPRSRAAQIKKNKEDCGISVGTKKDVMFILQAKKINICSNSQIAGSILGSYRRTLSEVSYICSTV